MDSQENDQFALDRTCGNASIKPTPWPIKPETRTAFAFVTTPKTFHGPTI